MNDEVTQIIKDKYNEYADKVINEIQELGPDCLHSGDDSGLDDVWEEFKFQVQEGESIFYEFYEATILSICSGVLKKLSVNELKLLWLISDGYYDWNEDWSPGTNELLEMVEDELYSIIYNIAESEEVTRNCDDEYEKDDDKNVDDDEEEFEDEIEAEKEIIFEEGGFKNFCDTTAKLKLNDIMDVIFNEYGRVSRMTTGDKKKKAQYKQDVFVLFKLYTSTQFPPENLRPLYLEDSRNLLIKLSEHLIALQDIDKLLTESKVDSVPTIRMKRVPWSC
ncbi:hypothetical protein EHS13_13525 [Paenibacillus psychroresistens]|uniref:Uncharacterized protein n=1 Tax=Paenibacillus psychroresistens TaxID=1778678 RepID=A0A6B8RJT5_9BACL|nr:hypothetical protein [Paenibacillus psychroresistens]QGQ95823.1 hypothetical protein EHS13_13525 [Paenibacillus psychroresistens]